MVFLFIFNEASVLRAPSPLKKKIDFLGGKGWMYTEGGNGIINHFDQGRAGKEIKLAVFFGML